MRKSAESHLGVATDCGRLPGTIRVLVPLPLFIRRLPGIVVVSNDPTRPVTKAGPLDVTTDSPAVVPRGALLWASAWLCKPASKPIATTAVGIPSIRKRFFMVCIISVSFPHEWARSLPTHSSARVVEGYPFPPLFWSGGNSQVPWFERVTYVPITMPSWADTPGDCWVGTPSP